MVEKPTDPASLKWAPLFGLMGGYLRLRLNVTAHNASEELLEAYQKTELPDRELPEISGLLRAIERSCERAKLNCSFEKGPSGLQEDIVSHYEPYKVKWELEKATLSLVIAPGEIQLILRKANKEPKPRADQLEIFKKSMLDSIREWLRRGNR